MAQWKKVITSGSIAELNVISASAHYVQENQQLASPSLTRISGSFSGSFTGDGSKLDLISLDYPIINGLGIADLSYNGTGSATVSISSSLDLATNRILKWTGTGFTNTSLTDDGALVSGTSSIQLSGINSSLTGSFTGSFKGDGSNLTGLVTSLRISGSNGTGGSVNLLNQDLTITGVANEINTTISGQTLTIGLTDDVSITNDLTVGGNLRVNGDLTYLNVTNLLVEDKFILLNSGSAGGGASEGGIIIDEGSGIGHAFVFNSNNARWGFNAAVSQNLTTVINTAYVAAVVDLNNGSHVDSAEYQKNGNIKIDTIGNIWIYA
jgi:hypothetical protein